MAIRQSLILGIMLLIMLTVIFTYSITRLNATIDETLADMTEDGFYRFIRDKPDPNSNVGLIKDSGRDTMTIYIDSDNIVKLSNIAFYDSETIDTIIERVSKDKSPSGRLNIKGNRIAYAFVETNDGNLIHVFDYSKDYENIRNMLVAMVIAGSLGLVAIILFSFKTAKNSVDPIEAAFVKQQELVANASHELKTPLTIINADLEILNSSRDSMSQEQLRWLDSINGQVGRMSNLITEMLELAKFEAMSDDLSFEDVNLSEVTEGVVLGVEALAFEHNITFETNIREHIMVSAVSKHIEKLIYILVENALKYTNVGGTVTVSLESDRKRAVLKVKNTGDGVSKENLTKLFDRFYRADEAHTSTGSFGLGLAIAKSIVDAHGGKIGADSVEGKYTEFTVVLRQVN